MRKWMFLALCIITHFARAQYPGYTLQSNTDAFRAQSAKAAQSTQSIQCDFVQDKNLSMLSDKIVSKGKFWFKRENKVRMEYEKPSYYLVVINGSMIKTKDGQKENKVSAKSNKMFEQVTKMMVDCMQGTMLDNKSFSGRLFEGPKTYLLELTPTVKSMQGIFRTISLVIDKKDFSVDKLEMVEQSGDNTIISFLHKQMNVTIPDELFSVK